MSEFFKEATNTKPSIEKISPCPFCEGESRVVCCKDPPEAHIRCTECQANGPHMFREFRPAHILDCIEAWNELCDRIRLLSKLKDTIDIQEWIEKELKQKKRLKEGVDYHAKVTMLFDDMGNPRMISPLSNDACERKNDDERK